jgi:anti-sigma factor RsiW
MCNEREPLLAYLYSEGDPEERHRVEVHLETCEACRDELAGLRSVREDLLAWEVPDHESVWKPFTPARPVWSWRDVPAWTMAAAAAVILALGATGSVAANALMAESATSAKAAKSGDFPPVLMTAGVPAAPGVVNVLEPLKPQKATTATAVTEADLAALEQRVLDEMSHRAQRTPTRTSLSSSDYDQLFAVMTELNNALANGRNDVKDLKTRVNDLSTTVAQLAQSQQGGREPRE